MNATSITRKQIQDTFKGELHRNGEYIGQVHLIDGTGYVLSVSDGRVTAILEQHPVSAFRKIGSYRVSAFQTVTKWTA